MRRGHIEVMLSVATLAALLLVLAASDDRVREQVSIRTAEPAVGVSTAGRQLREVAGVLMQSARDQSIEHAPLVTFVAAAAALTVFMLRT